MINPGVTRIATVIGEGFKAAAPLGGTLKLDFGMQGCVFIEGASAPVRVSALDAADAREADCMVAIDLDTFNRILAGKLDASAVYLEGRMKIAGNVGLALKLGPALKEARKTRESG